MNCPINMSRLAIRISLLASAAALAGPALAQDATLDGETASGENAEIIVTATKRAENAQDVPIAITALDGGQIRDAGITGTEDLKAVVPALNVTTAVGGFGLPRIRGIGATGQGVGIENPVAVYADGVYYGAAFGVLQSLFDVDQVAVLKGPQGTLFGRNATGGLIQITTRGPSFDWTGKAQIGYGNYETMSGAAYISGPLADKIAFSVSAQYESRDEGFGQNVFSGRDVQTAENWTMRGKLLFELGEDTSVRLAGDFTGRNASEPAFRNFGLNSLGQNVTNQIIALGGNPDYDIYSDIDPVLTMRQWGTSLTVDHDFGGVKLKSITAYRKSKMFTFFDPDGTVSGGRQLAIGNNYRDKQFTQEINLISDTSGPFQWVVGGFFMSNVGQTVPRPTWVRNFFTGNYTDTLANSKLKSYSAFAEGTYQLGESTRLTAGIRYTKDDRDLTVNQQTYCAAVAPPTCTAALLTTSVSTAPVSITRTFEKPSWRVSLDHRFSPEVLAYASYNRGFRSGTFVPQATPLIVLNPELVDAFELGLKTDLFDRRVRFNLSAYYYDQTNVQVMQIIAGVQNVYNAKGAEIYGLDADISLQITDNLKLFGGFNYAHARYTDFTDAILSIPFPVSSTFTTTAYTYVDSVSGATIANTACLGTFLPTTITTQAGRDGFYRAATGGNCLIRGDASGNKLQNTPTWTASLGGSFDMPTEIGKFTLAGNVYYNGGFVASPDERVAQPHYTTVDASLTWRHTNEHLYVRFWGKNLTNAFYRSQLGASNSGDNGYTSAPRTFGASIGVDF